MINTENLVGSGCDKNLNFAWILIWGSTGNWSNT